LVDVEFGLFFNGDGSAGNEIKLVNPVQTIITDFNGFYQARFAEGIGYHIADFYILKNIAGGIVV
jgi:hypothetical protein